MRISIIELDIYVKIKHVAKRRKQLKEIWKKPFEKEFERIWKSCWQDSNQVIH